MLLYIHIPFCDSKCFYCAFNSYTSLHNLKDDYMIALEKQLKHELKQNNKNIETIFIGGGTPSTINPSKYKKILDIVRPYIKSDIEITIEANPNSASVKWLQGIYDVGINRVSFGVQSFNDEKLAFLGRNHNKKQAVEAIHNAFNIGFKNINLDIIYDTTKDNKKLLEDDIDIIKTLPINHISAYSLTIEEGTRFFNKSNIQVENEELARYFFKQLNNIGFEQYEISNFSKNEDARSKHNLGYWEYKEYLGVGSGAVGCIENKRFYSQKDIIQYIQDPLKYEQIESLTNTDIKIEKILLGFRSVAGVNIEIFTQEEKEKVLDLINHKKLNKKNKKVYSTDFMLADEISLYLDI